MANETRQEQWENSFPPRSVIGEYFGYCIEFVRDNLPENISLLEYGRAQRVTGEPHRWIIATEHQDIVAEELLLAVGHAVTAPDTLTSKDTEEIADRLFESGNEVSVIYPTDLQGIFLDAKPPVEELDNLLDAEYWEIAEDEIAGADSLAEILDVIRELCADVFAELGISAPKGTYNDILKGPSLSLTRASLIVRGSAPTLTPLSYRIAWMLSLTRFLRPRVSSRARIQS